MSKLVVILLTICGTVFCKTLPAHNVGIVGGHDTDIATHPWQISLQLNQEHTCGGLIINNEWILTAAHCVDTPSDRNNLSVVAGATKWNNGGQRIAIKNFILHEHFNAEVSFENDIALLQLSSAITIANAKAIKLPPPNLSIPVGSNISVTGWGLTKENGNISTILQEVVLSYVSLQDCIKAYGGEVTSLMNCAGYKSGGRGSCQFDSGGPAVYEDQVIGIVSFGIGCATRQYPDVFTSVPKFISWIQKNML